MGCEFQFAVWLNKKKENYSIMGAHMFKCHSFKRLSQQQQHRLNFHHHFGSLLQFRHHSSSVVSVFSSLKLRSNSWAAGFHFCVNRKGQGSQKERGRKEVVTGFSSTQETMWPLNPEPPQPSHSTNPKINTRITNKHWGWADNLTLNCPGNTLPRMDYSW